MRIRGPFRPPHAFSARRAWSNSLVWSSSVRIE
jgi:hypothetical protein